MAKSTREKYKSFEKWRTQEVEMEFGLIRKETDAPFLENFLSNLVVLKDNDKNSIFQLQVQLRSMIEAWNEYDMSILFIGPLFNIVQSQEKRVYRTFFNHTLKTILNNKEITGRVDGMLAKGWQIPSIPLFFMQEYKAESGPNGDPLGQLLIEMVAAQAMNNETDQKIYGCYIIGRNWFFVLLQGKEYAVSLAYDATQNDIYDIVGILKKIKNLFEIKIGYVTEK